MQEQSSESELAPEAGWEVPGRTFVEYVSLGGAWVGAGYLVGWGMLYLVFSLGYLPQCPFGVALFLVLLGSPVALVMEFAGFKEQTNLPVP